MQQHIQQIANAIQYLASVCDGAKSRDFQGFSSFDKNLGHYLADKIASTGTLTQADLNDAVDLVWKYRKQLGAATIAFPTRAELAAELGAAAATVQPLPSDATVSAWMENNYLVVKFSCYDATKLGQLLQTVPDANRWWDGKRELWVLTPDYAADITRLYDIDVATHPPAQRPIYAVERGPRRLITEDWSEILPYGTMKVRFAQDGRLIGRVAALKATIPAEARAYEPDTCTWTIRCDYVTEVEQILGIAVAL